VLNVDSILRPTIKRGFDMISTLLNQIFKGRDGGGGIGGLAIARDLE